ncbi:MAG TPA: hypothetical protein VNL77_01620 [Roseiflexaceae bacterium]|nr:hypothetical protein [Roseiflexaceae bacterium]
MRTKILRALAAALVVGTLALAATAPYGAPGTRGPSSLSSGG